MLRCGFVSFIALRLSGRVFTAVLAAIAALSIAVAATPLGPATPVAVVQETQRQLRELRGDARALPPALDGLVDFDELARRALGPEWQRLDERQRRDLGKAMRELLRAAYAQRRSVEGMSEPKIDGDAVDRDQATVTTTLSFAGEAVAVVYRLHRVAARWRIYDVVTDDVSLAESYGGPLRKLLAERGFAGMMARLRERTRQSAN